MKTSKKLLVCLIMVLAGGVIGSIGRALGGQLYSINWGINGLHVESIEDMLGEDWSGEVLEAHGTESDDICFQGFEDVEVYCAFGEIELREGDRYAVVYKIPDNLEADVEVADNKLHVSIDAKSNKVSWSGGNGEDYCCIYYPKGSSLGDVSIVSSSGDVVLDNITCSSLTVDDSFGDIKGARVEAQDVQLISSAGDIKFEEIKSQTCMINQSFGDVELGTVNAQAKFECNSSSGDITVDKLDSGDVYMETSFGSVTVGLADNNGNIGIDACTSFGDVTINGDECGREFHREVAGDKKVTINCSSGDIEIK